MTFRRLAHASEVPGIGKSSS
ncbi:hypothetical protein IEZ25_14895 [Nocardioides hwasunensis]|uniref:Uncharacterized protein n=1 Tax=Nocardioides hwasunensis TaxID=397258 RepID=A0ABR8MIM3_9ACTN|nr:hypothetical protein [Nocardioides hwasunensis]